MGKQIEAVTVVYEPIETALRDETPRLLWSPRYQRRMPVVGFWSSWNHGWTAGEVDRMHDHVLIASPTHWAPLPMPTLSGDPS